MIIRPAVERDTTNIIALLKQSLGESTIPKSEALWNWKHKQNPFGASYVLLAEEDGKLIGLRAFMQWQWQWKNKLYKAIRAVDTATHPDYQGKGIFKKLTLQQAEECKRSGIDFVFNSPNKQSLPGYIKMGWKEQGKMPLKINVRLSTALLSFINKKEIDLAKQDWNIENLQHIIDNKKTAEAVSTVLSTAYFSWRYANNPLFSYQYFTDEKQYFVVTRIKPHSFANELRITDFVLPQNDNDVRYIRKDIKKNIIDFCHRHHIGFITLSGRQYKNYYEYFSWMGMIPVRDIGPMITLKDLNMNDSFNDLLNKENWCYSLGDMELF